jgi:uncharacterized protein YwqG
MASNDVGRQLKRFDLADYQEVVADALEPAVRLIVGRPAKRALAIGRSKFGGEPHLPDPADWPRHPSGRPLHFLAQIRLSDLPPRHLSRRLLPGLGWLRFWEDRLGLWIDMNSPRPTDYLHDGFRVTFSRAEQQPLVRCANPRFGGPVSPVEKHQWDYKRGSLTPGPEAAMRFEPMTSIHHLALLRLFAAMEADDPARGRDRVHDFYGAIHRERGAFGNHRLMGDVYEAMTGDKGSNMRADCVRFYRARRAGTDPWQVRPGTVYKPVGRREMKPWRLLAMFDSDDRLDWLWSDAGRLCFWIRERDLANRDFSTVQGIIDSA